MKYDEAINMMLNNVSCGFHNLAASSLQYKAEVKAEIIKAKCSIATAKVFLGFVDEKLKAGVSVKLDSTMLEAAICVGNGFGLDPTTYSPDISNQDSMELRMVAGMPR